jgi:hypothetical protein
MNARARGIERDDARCRFVCLLTILEEGQTKFTPIRKQELVAYTILATMDELSTVFKTREHTAHVRVVGMLTKFMTSVTGPSVCPSISSQSWNIISMPEKIPLTMAQKSAQPQRYVQHIPVTARTTIVRVHFSQRRLPKIT